MPPRSYKRQKKSTQKKPNWVISDVENPELGIVYNIYACEDQECIQPHHIDKEREKFKRVISVPWRKKKSLEQCCAKHKSLLLIKYKKCPCGREYWGTRLKSSQTCKACSNHSTADTYEKIPTRYYRLGDYYRETTADLGDPNRSDCTHRSECLKVTFDQGNKKGIACKDCPYYRGFEL